MLVVAVVVAVTAAMNAALSTVYIPSSAEADAFLYSKPPAYRLHSVSRLANRRLPRHTLLALPPYEVGQIENQLNDYAIQPEAG